MNSQAMFCFCWDIFAAIGMLLQKGDHPFPSLDAEGAVQDHRALGSSFSLLKHGEPSILFVYVLARGYIDEKLVIKGLTVKK